VKDREISPENVQNELGTFAKKVKHNQINGLAIVAEIDDASRMELREAGVTVLTLVELYEDVLLWDWRKQDDALHGMLHYLAHVEQNVWAVQRLLAFIRTLDGEHDSLAYAEEAAEAPDTLKESKPKKDRPRKQSKPEET
jgi:hypothetical protein